jgi:hypothetical protein
MDWPRPHSDRARVVSWASCKSELGTQGGIPITATGQTL